MNSLIQPIVNIFHVRVYVSVISTLKTTLPKDATSRTGSA